MAVRNNFEKRVSEFLKDAEYEPDKLAYTCEHYYVPDFKISDFLYVESKGYFKASDRAKQKLIRSQHPKITILICFQNPNLKISKKSKTTYGEWCTKNDIPWCTVETLTKSLQDIG